MTAQQTEGFYLLRFIMSEFISLYSGSSGNSSVVRCGERYLIVDMGKGVRTTGAALKELELNISDCDGILVTHEHSDHVKGLSTFLKKYPLPVYGAEEPHRDPVPSILPQTGDKCFSSDQYSRRRGAVRPHGL